LLLLTYPAHIVDGELKMDGHEVEKPSANYAKNPPSMFKFTPAI
jgi:hypothetical protein